MEYGKWLHKKPEFDEECTFVTATTFKNDVPDYKLWQIVRVENPDGWYYGLCEDDGEEWGDLADLTADMYFIIPPIKPI